MVVVGTSVRKSTKEDKERIKEIMRDDAHMVDSIPPREMYAQLARGEADILLSGGRTQFVALKAKMPWLDINQERHHAYAGYDGMVELVRQLDARDQQSGLERSAPPRPVAGAVARATTRSTMSQAGGAAWRLRRFGGSRVTAMATVRPKPEGLRGESAQVVDASRRGAGLPGRRRVRPAVSRLAGLHLVRAGAGGAPLQGGDPAADDGDERGVDDPRRARQPGRGAHQPQDADEAALHRGGVDGVGRDAW